jgi:hypothetical protein
LWWWLNQHLIKSFMLHFWGRWHFHIVVEDSDGLGKDFIKPFLDAIGLFKKKLIIEESIL